MLFHVYLQHKAKVLYAKQDYQNAYNIYMQLQSTRMYGPENMYAATQCQQAMGADFSVLIQHMDSTIAVCPKPMTYQSAPNAAHPFIQIRMRILFFHSQLIEMNDLFHQFS